MQNKTRKKRITTVTDILTLNEVNNALDDIVEHRADINDLVIIYRNRAGEIHINYSSEQIETTVFLLRRAEHIMLTPDTEEE